MSVVAVARSSEHAFKKPTVDSITLIQGFGIEGDAHYGATVQHRSRLHIRPPPDNLRQVHLISSDALEARGLEPGDIGENITIRGLDLLALSSGTKLRFTSSGDSVTDAPTIILTGVRNPCSQIEKFRKGLQESFIIRDGERKIVRRLAGVMAIVLIGGVVTSGMMVRVEEPKEHITLVPV